MKCINIVSILFIYLSSLTANTITITIEEMYQAEPGDLLEITWETDLGTDALVTISYSYNGSNWDDIEEVRAKEGSYYWLIPENIQDSDGLIYIRVYSPSTNKSSWVYDTVKIKLKGMKVKLSTKTATKKPAKTSNPSSSNVYTSGTNKSTGYLLLIESTIDNIRAAPSASGTIIKKCRKGETYVHVGEHGNWYKILYNGDVVYTHRTNGRLITAYSDEDFCTDIFTCCILPLLLLFYI